MEKMGERAKSWSIPMLVLKNDNKKLFHEYMVEQLE